MRPEGRGKPGEYGSKRKKNVSREKLSKMEPESGPWSIQAVGGGESQIRNE